jgi:predicted kinase
MSELVIVRGLPGSGKSHYVKDNYKTKNYLYYEPDYLITDVFGNYRFNAQIWDSVNVLLFKLVDFALARKENVVIADVFTNESSLLPYIILTQRHQSKLNIVTIIHDCLDSDGSLSNTHNLALSVFEDMRKEFKLNLDLSQYSHVTTETIER